MLPSKAARDSSTRFQNYCITSLFYGSCTGPDRKWIHRHSRDGGLGAVILLIEKTWAEYSRLYNGLSEVRWWWWWWPGNPKVWSRRRTGADCTRQWAASGGRLAIATNCHHKDYHCCSPWNRQKYFNLYCNSLSDEEIDIVGDNDVCC